MIDKKATADAPRTLALSANLHIPVDFVTRRVAALGMSGAGKSNAFAVMIEQTHRCGGVFVAFDPLGTLWGLRAAADGIGPGLPVPIFGGHHADVEISSSRGALLARELFEANASALIDLSAFEGDERCTFVADFTREKMKLHARRKKPLAFFVDEVHLLAPETPQSKAENRCEIALADIHTGGRGVGIGLKTATQSAAEQSKRTLKQAELVIAMRTFSPLDQKQIKAYLGSATTPDRAREVLASLARLRDGEAWFISPHWLGMIEQHRFALRETFDSSRTPEVGETIAEPKQFAAVDLERLRDAMAEDDVESEAEGLDSAVAAHDVAKLRSRIAELETKLASPTTITKTEYVEVPVVADSLIEALRETFERWEHVVTHVRGDFEAISAALARFKNTEIPPVAPAEGAAPKTTAKTQNRTVRAERVARASSAASALPALPRSLSSDVQIKAGARRMLVMLARNNGTLPKENLGILSEVNRASGTFSEYLSALRSAGYITDTAREATITPAGAALVGETIRSSPMSTAEIVAMYSPRLKAGARRMLDLLIKAYPEAMTKAALGEQAEVNRASGTFSEYLAALRKCGLIKDDARTVRASEILRIGKGKR